MLRNVHIPVYRTQLMPVINTHTYIQWIP